MSIIEYLQSRSGILTSMADSSVVDLDSDFVISRRADFDIFDREVLASFPGDSGLDEVS